MQIARLLETVYLLLEKRTMTAHALADYFEVSVRTIYRDIDVLSQAGIPIYTSKGKGGGISLMDHYVLNRSLLTKEEQEQILTSLSAMRHMQEEQPSRILQKMTGIFQKEPLDWIDVDFHDWTLQKQQKNFDLIKHAIFEQTVISFTYMDIQGQHTQRKIEPMKLIFKGRAWYVWGYCLKRNAARFFRLTRIQELYVTKEHYTRRDIVLKTDLSQNHRYIPVRLKVNKKSAFRILDELPYRNMQTTEDDIIVKADITDQSWMIDYLLSFGDQLEILEPISLREALKERITAIQKLYEKRIG